MILTIVRKGAQNWCILGSPGSSKNGSRMRALVMFDVDAIDAMSCCCWCVNVCEKVLAIEKVQSERTKSEGTKTAWKNGGRRCVQWSALGVFKIRRRVWESGTECYECVVLM